MPVNLNRPDGLLNGCFTPGPKPAILRAAPVSGYVAGTRGGRLGEVRNDARVCSISGWLFGARRLWDRLSDASQ